MSFLSFFLEGERPLPEGAIVTVLYQDPPMTKSPGPQGGFGYHW
jgi:hypothetical protein